MGSKSKPTIGYWYKVLLHLGVCQGPVDALLELRGGDKTAWTGVQEGSGTITINAKELWGGEKAEGGIQGDLDVMMGEGTQMPNAYLAANLGPEQSAFRGKVTMVFKGGFYGAFNPYPKPLAAKTRRIYEGWHEDDCWYPEKAGILLSGDPSEASVLIGQNGGANGAASTPSLQDYVNTFAPVDWEDYPAQVQLTTLALTDAYVDATYPRRHLFRMDGNVVWDSGWYGLPADQDALDALLQSEGREDLLGPIASGLPKFVYDRGDSEPTVSTQAYVAMFADARPDLFNCTAELRTAPIASTELFGMNAVHILYDSITHPQMQGEPADLIDADNFAAAADRAYDEGFGLCTEYDAGSETVEDFQKRILNVLGASCSQSRVDGKYRITLVRDDYDLESLPILGDDNILEYAEEPTDPLEAVNQVTVEWFDPVRKQERAAGPLQSLGAITAAGGVIAETLQHPEIPTEALALRVGARNLALKSSGLKRFELTTDRTPYAWRGGQFFRLQAPRRGIADMVCMVGDLSSGTRRSGSMRLSAIQDVSRMPSSTYVVPEPGVDTRPPSFATVPPAQLAFEVPYIELAGTLPEAELTALASDAGYVGAVAARPSAGLNYDVWSSLGSEPYEDRGGGDWCPTALVDAGGVVGPLEQDLILESGTDLDRVAVGSAVLWDGEICRVTAIDADAQTLSLARGCADTVPAIEHAPGTRLWFYDAWTATDSRQYADGELVKLKLLSRTASNVLLLEAAPTQLVTLAARAARPYPPGRLRITDDLASDVAYPASAIGELTVSWAHRDRVLQDDQLIDESAASVGPEAGTTYTVRYYLEGVLDEEETGITGTSGTPYTVSGNGLVRVEVESVRGGLASWQAAAAEFAYTASAPEPLITEAGDAFVTEAGDALTTE